MLFCLFSLCSMKDTAAISERRICFSLFNARLMRINKKTPRISIEIENDERVSEEERKTATPNWHIRLMWTWRDHLHQFTGFHIWLRRSYFLFVLLFGFPIRDAIEWVKIQSQKSITLMCSIVYLINDASVAWNGNHTNAPFMEVKIELDSNNNKNTAHPKPITKCDAFRKSNRSERKAATERKKKFVSISAEVRPLFVNKLEEPFGAHDTHHSKAQNWRSSLHSST